MAALFAESVRAAGDACRTDGGRPLPDSCNDAMNTAFRDIRSALRCPDQGKQHSCAIIIDYGTQLLAGPDGLRDSERHAFLQLLKSSQESQLVGYGPGERQNLLIVVCGELNDLPIWTYMDNPFSGSIAITEPSRIERANLFARRAQVLDPDEAADLTDGMTVRDLTEIARLAEDEAASRATTGAAGSGVSEAERKTLPKTIVDRYKFGDRASLWSEVGWGDLANAEERLAERVFGQPAAIHHVSEVLRRARLHLSGAQHSGRGTPRGVLFFAGPTGVGKTELAKAITDLLFGDEEHYARFDMSEYGAEHSDQRLVGAPPGYVGYDAGGQLTNRVREEPFSVLLFDEMDKAHNRILDKFLQILEDGRMTDGRGRTVFFSECLLIFTTNAGMYEPDGRGGERLRISDPEGAGYEEVRDTVMQGVREFFLKELRRPELLGRFGENIIIFDFVREPYLTEVLKKAVEGVCERVWERWGIVVEVPEDVVQKLHQLCGISVAEGGRGVGNKVELRLLNPLSRWLFENIPSRLAATPAPVASPASAPAAAPHVDNPFATAPAAAPHVDNPFAAAREDDPLRKSASVDAVAATSTRAADESAVGDMSDRAIREGLDGAHVRITDILYEEPAQGFAGAGRYTVVADWV